jgi:hypothetical protein
VIWVHINFKVAWFFKLQGMMKLMIFVRAHSEDEDLSSNDFVSNWD